MNSGVFKSQKIKFRTQFFFGGVCRVFIHKCAKSLSFNETVFEFELEKNWFQGK